MVSYFIYIIKNHPVLYHLAHDSQTSINIFFSWRVVCDESSQGDRDPRCGGCGVPFFYCAIHQRTNQCEVFGVLFIVDKANTSLYIFMRKVGSCDESYQG